MRRSAIALVPCLLLAATAFVLAQLAGSLADPSPILPAARADADGANGELIRRFYAAANEALRAGDPAPFEVILAPSFVAHGVLPGGDADRAGFQTYLGALHAVYPDLRLTVDDLIAGEDMLVARVAVHGIGRAAFAGAVVSGATGAWGASDGFRVRDGRIAELWGSGGGVVLGQVPSAIDLAGPGPAPVVALDRLRFAPGAGGVPPVDRRDRLVWIEAGEVALSVVAGGAEGGGSRPSVTVIRATAKPAAGAEAVPPGESSILRGGDLVVIPGGIAYDLVALGSEVALGLGVSLATAPAAAPAQEIVDPRRGDAAALDPAPALSGWPLGAAVERLAAWEIDAGPAEDAELAVGRLALGSGARLTLGQAEGPVLIVVDSGISEPTGRGGALRSGEHLVLPAGGSVDLTAARAAPLTCLVVALVPASGRGLNEGTAPVS